MITLSDRTLPDRTPPNRIPPDRTPRRLALWSALAALTLATAPALAQDPAYVGTWAFDVDQCATPQDSLGAPLVIARDRYDQHEAHCEFKMIEGGAPTWMVAALCTVEGSAHPMEFALSISGETLTVSDDSGSRDLVKCK